MPAQVGKSGLFAKLGAKGAEAWNKTRSNEIKYAGGGADLPAGFSGIARLVECKFDQFKEGDNKGEYFFYAAGVVVSPKVFKDADGNVHHLEGQRTSIMEAVCNTPQRTRKTIEEHMAWVVNELKKLGLDTSTIGPENVETAVKALKEAGPLFRFRTWMGKPTPQFPDPRVNHTWNGLVSEEAAAGSGLNGAADHSQDVVEDSNDALQGEALAAGEGSPEDLEALATAAGEGDVDAQDRLKDLAKEAGISDEDVENAADWQVVVEYIHQAAEQGNQDAAEPEPEPEPEEWKPAKDDQYRYTITDPKTKRKRKIDVEVTAVNEKAKTVSIREIGNPKVKFDKVAWDLLEQID